MPGRFNMTASAPIIRILRYFKARFGTTDVYLRSPLSRDRALSAIANDLAKPGLAATLTVPLGDPFVYGQVSGNRVVLNSRTGLRQSQPARLTGEVDAAADGGSQLLGQIAGMTPLLIFVGCYFVATSIFLAFFAYAAFNPQLSKPPIPWWLVLVPLGFDLLAVFIVEALHAGRKANVRGLQAWLSSRAQFSSNDTGSPN
jgi:hypothetical protein